MAPSIRIIPVLLLPCCVLAGCGSGSTEPSAGPTQLAFAVQPGGATGGSAFSVQPAVEVLDGSGRKVAGATNTVTLALLSGSSGARLSGSTSKAAANGLATFSDLAIDLVGAGYALVATAPGLKPDTCAPFNVAAGAAATLSFSTQPAQANGGDPFGQQPTVDILDLGGNRVAQALSVTITLDSGPAGATLSGASTVTATAGRATFVGLSIDKAGSGYRLTATSSGLTPAVSARFSVAVGPPSLTRSYVTSTWSLMNVGDTTTLTLWVRDNGGNPVTVPLSSWQFGNPPGPYVGRNNGDGSYSATVTPGATTEAHVTASVNGALLQSAPAVVKVVRFTKISAGGGHTCALTPVGGYGDIYCWGDGEFGQLGNGSTASSTVPVLVSGGIHWASVSAGDTHTCGVDVNGTAYCWGRNAHGALGIGLPDDPSSNRSVPTAVSGNLVFLAVHAGLGSTTCGSVQGFSAYCWGNNSSGQLGDSTMTDSPVPVLARGGHLMNNVAVGRGHVCATSSENGSDSIIFCWGSDSADALGLDASAAPSACQGGPCALTPTPVVIHTSMLPALFQPLLGLGGSHACLDGNDPDAPASLVCWGANGSGQLGDGTLNDRAAAASPTGQPILDPPFLGVGDRHTCAVIASSLQCWGDNSYGQLGDGTRASRTSPTPVAGGLVFPRFVGYAPFEGSVAAGARHSCTVAGDDHTYCWGDNSQGQLGTGTTNLSLVPVRITIQR